jgi:signal transduction histidine kinase/ActR/RegA family two-component response regulator
MAFMTSTPTMPGEQETKTVHDPERPERPVNILMVDDQPAKLLSYEVILAGLGENLLKASSGKEALEYLLRHEVAVVLIDVCMPELDGFELASMIRSHPRFQKTAIILVSGVLVEDVDRLRGYDSGAVDYVSVPIVPEILRAKVAVFAELFRKTEDLQLLNQRLEQRVTERTAEIEALLRTTEDARREAEQANRLKDEFLAILSHELRTPLNAITGWAHMLRAGGLDPATQVKAVESINRNALLQARLIADLLDVSRVVSGKLRLDLKQVALSSVIQGAIDTARPGAEAKGIELDADVVGDIGSITGDTARLHQVVSNLLSNAIKFAPAKGSVQVRLQGRGSHVELTVRDDGPGIRPDVLPHVFERFRQGDASTTRAHKGLGLGLAIVKHLVEMHGGTVQAQNREDRSGAIFKVRLPLAGSLARTSSGAPPFVLEDTVLDAPISSVENMRILVVDDEADAREVVATALERCGAEVMVAASAVDALEILERERPDVLVADIEMPGEDGYSLIRKIRVLPGDRGGETPAVALTAYASASDRARLLSAGFSRHVPKPVQPPELISVIGAFGRPNSRPKGSREAVSRQEPSSSSNA